jgi:hypothetical protein
MLSPPVCFISSPANCWVVPTPALPKLSLPGLARTAASTPARSLPGKSGLVTSTRPAVATIETIWKSLTGS